MAKILRDLLDAQEPQFSLALKQLERESGEAGRDAQLIGDIAFKMNKAVCDLGLDFQDTTGRELYAAHLAHVANADERLQRLLGIAQTNDVVDTISRVIQAVEKLAASKSCWVLKRSCAKKVLKSTPPKKLMKHLGYRSIDSMLKHEPIDELFAVVRFFEDETWLHAYGRLLKQVKPSDFETRAVSILSIQKTKYAVLSERHSDQHGFVVMHAKEVGVVAVLSLEPKWPKGMTLAMLVFILQNLQEVRLFSALFKLKQVASHFGEVVARSVTNDTLRAVTLAGQNVDWRVVQRHLGYSDDSYVQSEVFQPHIQPEDLQIGTIERILAAVDPNFTFWGGLEYVGKRYDDGIASFNILDACLNLVNSIPFEKSSNQHFHDSLWNELLLRYIGAENFTKRVLDQLGEGPQAQSV